MALILAELARGLSGGALDSQKFKIERQLEELAAQRRIQESNTQRAFLNANREDEQEFQLGRDKTAVQERKFDRNEAARRFGITTGLQERGIKEGRERFDIQQASAEKGDIFGQKVALEQLDISREGLELERARDANRAVAPGNINNLPDSFLEKMDRTSANDYLSDPMRLSLTNGRDIAIMSYVASTGKNPMKEKVDAGDSALALQRMTDAFWQQALLKNNMDPNTDPLTLETNPELMQMVVNDTNLLLTNSQAVDELARLSGTPNESIIGGPITPQTIREAVSNRPQPANIEGLIGGSSFEGSAPRVRLASEQVFTTAMGLAQQQGIDTVINELELVQQFLVEHGSGPSLGPLRAKFPGLNDANLFLVIQALRARQQQEEMLKMQQQMSSQFNVGNVGPIGR